MLQNVPNDKLQAAIDEAQAIAGLLIRHDRLIAAIPDRKYRCGTVAKPRGINGWYVVKHDGVSEFITIVYGNFELGDTVKFKYHISLKDNAQPTKKLSPAERKALQDEMNARIEADRAKYEKSKQQKADYYVKEFNQLPFCIEHPYSNKKGIPNIKWYNLRHDIRFNRDLLCIPFVNDRGLIQGYQTIAPDGVKRFCGSVGGYYWQYPIINPNSLVFNGVNSFFILCEGVATGISAYEALVSYFDSQIFLPIILCAFNVGNLNRVITATKSQKLPYLLLVDNDSNKPKNAGIETCKQLLIYHSDCIIYPLTFPDSGDANDYILANGAAAFIQLIKKYATPVINMILR